MGAVKPAAEGSRFQPFRFQFLLQTEANLAQIIKATQCLKFATPTFVKCVQTYLLELECSVHLDRVRQIVLEV
jgi:hypothetical protein